MRIITWRKLKEAIEQRADADSPLNAWHDHLSAAEWKNPSDVMAFNRTVSFVGNRVVFNIGGNNYRLVVEINYVTKLVFVKWFGTHADYSKIDVKTV